MSSANGGSGEGRSYGALRPSPNPLPEGEGFLDVSRESWMKCDDVPASPSGRGRRSMSQRMEGWVRVEVTEPFDPHPTLSQRERGFLMSVESLE